MRDSHSGVHEEHWDAVCNQDHKQAPDHAQQGMVGRASHFNCVHLCLNVDCLVGTHSSMQPGFQGAGRQVKARLHALHIQAATVFILTSERALWT